MLDKKRRIIAKKATMGKVKKEWDIDYDKLAKCIIKEQKLVKTQRRKERLNTIWAFISNQKDTKGEMTRNSFAIPISVIFRALSVGLISLSFTFIYSIISAWCDAAWRQNTLQSKLEFTIILMYLIIFTFIFAIITWGSANEIDREKSNEAVLNVFNAVTSFAALIIAVIALFKGGT